jgi:ATP-dependent protease HslVU (ClpYQ) peptidase subunit
MTVIVGVVQRGTVWLGADRCVSDGSGNITVVTMPKLFRLGDCLCGTAGSVRVLNILRSIDVPKRKQRQSVDGYVHTVVEGVREAIGEFGALTIKENQHSTDNNLLIAVAGRLFVTDGLFAIMEPAAPYFATGAGDEYAMGALHALSRPGGELGRPAVVAALEAAAAFRADVSPPFDVLALPPTGRGRGR